ncbi:DUF1206 domain-containing protein [Devosia chinhatensis]|uniref:DUF1206 domain-containing protein n=1 Tax=Devosia chinhatensis TaxID=429727 RepID=A0A0F5FKZ9_9HYPH|nr:DUF1206 domain-containing protein [Devosia chinhatensis]KKB09488.1 hypothetical protein VE26_06115 [Devosia chinhatensis]
MHNKFELLARWGYAARGIVYAILGSLALFGAGAEASTDGALSTVLSQPFGRILLGLVAIGLIGHVLWRLAQSILNADHVDNDIKGIVARIASFSSAIVNGILAMTAASLALGTGGSDSGSGGEQGAAAMLLGQPFGEFLVGLVGLVLICAGAVQAWRGISRKYQERIKLPAAHENLLHPICVVGLAARGLLLAITGGFFAYAAMTFDPDQAGGISAALDWVHALPFGVYLYAFAAGGLIAFGAYSVIQARYRILDAPDTGDIRRTASKIPGISA